jgi:dCTP deaminase
MILSDGDITYLRSLGYLDIEPWDEARIQPASYDLTLGSQANTADGRQFAFTGSITLDKGDFWLLHTAEVVTLSNRMGAQVMGKSTWARRGLIVESAGWVDPGFSGQLVLEVTNLSPVPVVLRVGDPIAQIVFMELRNPALRPYGKERGSHYHGQMGATPAHTS